MAASVLRRARSRCWSRITRIRSTSDAGFSLLEVVVSFVIFSVVAGAATAAIVSALRASHSSQQRVDAAQVAQQFIADVQRNPGGVQQGSLTLAGAGVKNEHFVVTRTIEFTDNSAITCPSGTAMKIHVTVSQQQSGKFLARSDSVVAC